MEEFIGVGDCRQLRTKNAAVSNKWHPVIDERSLIADRGLLINLGYKIVDCCLQDKQLENIALDRLLCKEFKCSSLEASIVRYTVGALINKCREASKV